MATSARNHCWLGASALAAAVAISQPAQAQVRKFNIPAGSASRTIPMFGKQAGVQVLAAGRVVAGKRTNSVVGAYPVAEALTLLLKGTGLSGTPGGNGVIMISAAQLSSGDPASASDPASGVSQADPQPLPAEEEETKQEIVVTGTNIRGGRPTSPVIVMTRKDIDESGSTTVEQLMRKLPQNSQAGVGAETFFNPTASGTDRTESGAGVNLRGLGQRATLVLLNGRRVAPSSSGAFFDISLIPLSAVERVEILTDGASAIYGSDAVGGVVNFILRKDFNGLETLLEAGTATEGNGAEVRAGVTAGKSWGSGSAMLSYEYRHDDEIRARDRPFVLLPPDTFVLPREARQSVLGTFQQQLAPRLKLELTGIYAHRDTEHTFFYAGQSFPVFHTAKADFGGGTAQLSYDLGSSWLVRLEGGYSVSTNHSREDPSTGTGWINLDSTNRTLETSLAVDGSLLNLPAGPVKLAVGAGIRSEHASNLFYADQTGSADRKISETVRSAYGELLIPLFSARNRQPGLELLQFSAAARDETYSGLKSTFNPKLGLLWSPFKGLNFRGSYGTSFKAPLLLERIGYYQAIYLPLSVVSAIPTQDKSTVLFMSGSNPNVGPERARTWTFGGDIEPSFVRGLSLSVNYYRIRFSDRIATPSQTIALVGNPAFDSIIDRNPSLAEVTNDVNRASFLLDISGPGFSNGHATPSDVKLVLDDRTSNTAVTRTSGIDFLLNYRFDLGRNGFNLEANVTHVIDFLDQLTVTSPQIVGVNRPYRSLGWKGRAGISWKNGGWLANLFINYTDGYIDDRTINIVPVHSWTTLDAGLAYDFGQNASPRFLRNTRIALHVENLLDTDPPLLLPDPGSTTGLGFDPVNATARGRIVTVQLRKAW